MLTTLIFDAYGTLISTGTTSMDALHKILLHNGRGDIAKQDFYTRWKHFHRQHMDAAHPFVTEDTLLIRDLEQLYLEFGIQGKPEQDVQFIRDVLGHRTAFPETREVLRTLCQHFTVCIGSTTDTQPLLEDMARNDLQVHHIFTSEMLQAYKPEKIFYQQILHALGIAPEGALFIGDTLLDDVLGTQSAGIQSCWVNRKQLSPGNVHPDYIISDLNGLYHILPIQ